MTPEEFEYWKEKFKHVSDHTLDAASSLRFAAEDVGLDLGRLMEHPRNGDCAWFALTDGNSQYPLQKICILLCTPYGIMVEYLTSRGEQDQCIINDNHGYATELKNNGYRKLSDEEFLIFNGGGNT